MTTTAPDVDLNVLQALDWQHETPCDTPGCPHNRPPARWLIHMVCGCAFLSCHPCKEDLDVALEDDEVAGVAPICLRCRTQVPMRIREIVLSIEPLQ